MEPDYNNNYHNSYQSEFKPNGFDDLHLDDEVYEIKSDRINPEDFYQHSQKKRYSEVSLRNMPVVLIIILANLLAGIMCIIAGSDHFETGGLNYQYIHNNKEYIRLLTYMFLHANLPHFIIIWLLCICSVQDLNPVSVLFVLQLYISVQDLHQALYLCMYHTLSIPM